MRERSHLRLTYKFMAVGVIAPVGLLAFAPIYRIGSWSQDASRAVAGGSAHRYRCRARATASSSRSAISSIRYGWSDNLLAREPRKGTIR
jgi:hypothetical protein